MYEDIFNTEFGIYETFEFYHKQDTLEIKEAFLVRVFSLLPHVQRVRT